MHGRVIKITDKNKTVIISSQLLGLQQEDYFTINHIKIIDFIRSRPVSTYQKYETR